MIKNFLFHRVCTERDVLWDPMDPVLFDKCIKYISTHYKVLLLEDLVTQKKSFKLGEKLATIVFDDGYKDNIEHALPILEKYGVKASFYVVTDCIDKNLPTWTYLLDYSFQFTGKKEINFEFDFLPEDMKHKKFADDTEKLAYVRKLKPLIKNISHANRNQVMDRVTSLLNDVTPPSLMLSWDDIRYLKNKGHYIGSHSLSHAMLGTMSDEVEICTELMQSAKRIEQELGYFPTTISYPVGSYNETTIRLSKEVGYKMGLAVKQEAYNPANDGRFEIPRIELYNEPWLKTWLRINHTLRNLAKKIIRK